jgi:hypothetical protein
VDSVPSGEDRVGHGTHITATVMRIARWAEVYVATVVDDGGHVDPPSVAKVRNQDFFPLFLFTANTELADFHT